jgi:hypothetical protein
MASAESTPQLIVRQHLRQARIEQHGAGDWLLPGRIGGALACRSASADSLCDSVVVFLSS